MRAEGSQFRNPLRFIVDPGIAESGSAESARHGIDLNHSEPAPEITRNQGKPGGTSVESDDSTMDFGKDSGPVHYSLYPMAL